MSKESAKKGCIKATRGPWTVHKTTSDGDTVTRYRIPSDQERHKNKQRERHRRAVAKKIFKGLRVYGNYNLPKKADSNHLLMALCEEAGWHVEADGAVFKKDSVSTMASAILRKFQVEDTQLVKENNGINLALSLTCTEK